MKKQIEFGLLIFIVSWNIIADFGLTLIDNWSKFPEFFDNKLYNYSQWNKEVHIIELSSQIVSSLSCT